MGEREREDLRDTLKLPAASCCISLPLLSWIAGMGTPPDPPAGSILHLFSDNLVGHDRRIIYDRHFNATNRTARRCLDT
jgi:hypothetical protein